MDSALYNELLFELEKADKVIGVLKSHTEYLSEIDQKRLNNDLEARGLADHSNTRKNILKQAFNEKN